MGRTRVSSRVLAALCCLAAARTAASASLSAPRLDPARAVSLRNVEIELDAARLVVQRGLLVPTEAIEGRTLELVFVGQARFVVEPPDEIEAGQLELFTGRRTIEASVEEAVLAIADGATVERLLGRPPPIDVVAAPFDRAEARLAAWAASAERRTAGIESALYKTLAGDPAFDAWFALWIESAELGPFLVQHDPEDTDPLTVARFAPVDVRGWDRLRLAREIRLQQRKGRFLGVRVEDLGAWDLWMTAGGESAGGFEARAYKIDAAIRDRRKALEARARIEIEALADGRRTLSLELYRDLIVDSIRDGSGAELEFLRVGAEIVVRLREPVRAGERLVIAVDYRGRVLSWVARGTWDLAATDRWYPHCGAIDRASYDVTMRWPADLDWLAGGTRVAGGREGRERWERRVIEEPAGAFSFALGDFSIERERAAGVDVRVGFTRGSRRPERRFVVQTVASALEFHAARFGPFPLDELTVVVMPRAYAQSSLGFVTLFDAVMGLPGVSDQGAEWVRETAIGHEVAHQWWGNLIGWRSYRDQWLSEAMSNYAGLLFHARAGAGGETTLAELSTGWRDSLGQTLEDGRTVESLGPVVLGYRLNSSLASNGYRAIVYRKGAVVLAMLARAIGEERFLEILGEIARVGRGRVLTTESFVAAIERLAAVELDGFASQFIYGTGIPVVLYRHEVERAGEGAFRVVGEAERLPEPAWRQRLVRIGDGAWDVAREPLPVAAAAGVALAVPFLVAAPPGTGDPRRPASRAVQAGSLFLHGQSDTFAVETLVEPESFRLDPDGEVLASFVSAESHPKTWRRLRAAGLIARGRAEEAEVELRRALEAPSGEPLDNAVPRWLRNAESDAARQESAIRLALARLDLDGGREAEAEAQLAAVERRLAEDPDAFRMERDTLAARLEMRRGDHEAALRRLRKTLRLAFPEGEARASWRAWLWRLRLAGERLAVAEAFALLAAAAHERGDGEALAWARAEAIERRVDVGALEIDKVPMVPVAPL